MPTVGFKRVLAVFCLGFIFIFSGCNTPVEEQKEAQVLSVGAMGVTVSEFTRELDLKLSAYPYNIKDEQAEYNGIVMELISELSEQLVLVLAANEEGITVSQGELDAAEAAVRADYPEDSFEQMLLDNAVPYLFWKERLRKSLLMEKVIQLKVEDQLEISAVDIQTFYLEQASKTEDGSANKMIQDEALMIRRLKMEKRQLEYQKYLAKLKQRIPVEINKTQVTRLLLKSGIQEEKAND